MKETRNFLMFRNVFGDVAICTFRNSFITYTFEEMQAEESKELRSTGEV